MPTRLRGGRLGIRDDDDDAFPTETLASGDDPPTHPTDRRIAKEGRKEEKRAAGFVVVAPRRENRDSTRG